MSGSLFFNDLGDVALRDSVLAKAFSILYNNSRMTLEDRLWLLLRVSRKLPLNPKPL